MMSAYAGLLQNGKLSSTNSHLLSRGEKIRTQTSLSFLTSRRPTKSLIMTVLVRLFTREPKDFQIRGTSGALPYYLGKKKQMKEDVCTNKRRLRIHTRISIVYICTLIILIQVSDNLLQLGQPS
jgi:hypothetical protein